MLRFRREVGRVLRSRARTAGLLIVLAAALAPAWGIEQTGDLEGTVRDEKGQPMPGSTVTLRGDNLQGERAAVTGAGGGFAFRALPPGTYVVRVAAQGYQTTELDRLLVNVGRTTRVPVALVAGELTETVKVTARAPLVDTVNTQTQESYTPEYLEGVPVGSGGRDYLGVIQSAAGTGPGDGANPTVRGSTLGQNVYLVDGVDSTDPVTATFGSNFIYDAVQEIQFQTGGFAAEFGRATGGIVNIVTKSGGNRFSGSFDARYSNEDFIENGKHFNPDEVDLTGGVGEATFGGPIVKDKLWFFLAGSYVGSEFASADSPSVRDFEGTYYLGKLTWQVTANHRLIGQITGDPATIENVDASALVASEATSEQTQGSRFGSVQYQGVLSPSLLLHAQVATYRSVLDVEPQRGDFQTIGWLNFLTGDTSMNALDAQYSDRFRNQANATLTWQVPRLAGAHAFKFGVDAQKIKLEFEQLIPGGEYWDVAPDSGGTLTPLLYNLDGPAGRLTNEGLVTAFFVQDEWRVHPNVTLNAGLRYDTFSYDDDRGLKILEAELLQPRLGVAWDVTGDAKNVVKVYGGRFEDPSLLALPRVVNSRANFTELFLNEEIAGWLFDDPAGPTPFDYDEDGTISPRVFVGFFGGPGGSVIANGGKLEATSVVEYSASYERQVTPRTAAGLTLVRRKTYDIIEDEFHPNRGVYVIDNVGSLGRNYYGAELRFQTHWKTLSLWSSYTWSRSRGNIEYTQSLGTDWDFPELETKRYGYLTDDTRHSVKLNGYYGLPLGFQVGFGYAYLSGFPYNQVRSAFPYGVQFVEDRGSRRYSDLQRLDLDLRKRFEIGKADLQLIGSVLNVFDTETITAVNEQAASGAEPIGYQLPRRYEVGARVLF